MAEKARVKNWKDFRAAFLITFLFTNYMTKVGEKVRAQTSLLGTLFVINF